MHYIKMTMTPATPVDDSQEETLDLLLNQFNVLNYLTALYRNGQIYRNYELIKTDVGYCAFVMLPERDSLDDKYAGSHVRDYTQYIDQCFAVSFEHIGEKVGYDEPCACENPSWYYLNAQLANVFSPVVCGYCRRRKPLYRLPYITEYDSFHALQRWQSSYIGMNSIWLNDIANRFSYRQMNDPNSSLSKQGRELCRAFEKATGKPFYYLLFYYKNSREKNTSCPICGKPWRRVKADDFVSKRCRDCRLLAEGLNNVKKGDRICITLK